jgi:penicillin-binding protein 2
MSIGQGSLLASPLQVAQGMAGIANGGILPQLMLVNQQQDSHGRVTKASSPERRNWLGLTPNAVSVTQQGMSDVVNSGGGTGSAGQLSYAKLCGKTGTAQWGPPAKNQRLAWFAGFMPAENPRYAFAVLYEGKPGERVSGGRLAAPMVRKFFEGIKTDIKQAITPPKKALVVIDESKKPTPPAIIVDESKLKATEGLIREGDDAPLKAIPIVPLGDGVAPVPLNGMKQNTGPKPDLIDSNAPEPGGDQPAPVRAIPVRENGPQEPEP